MVKTTLIALAAHKIPKTKTLAKKVIFIYLVL